MDFLTLDPAQAFLSAFFGQTETPSPLLPLLALYNQTIAVIGGLWMFYVVSAGVVKTATGGKIAVSPQGGIRFIIAVSLFIPAPGGLTAGQIAFGNALNLSIEGAKKLYQTADDLVRRQGQPLVFPNDPQAYSLALDLGAFFMCGELVEDAHRVHMAIAGPGPGAITNKITRSISTDNFSYFHERRTSGSGGPDSVTTGHCGVVTVAKTGDGIAHEAAFRARVEAIERLIETAPPIFANAFPIISVSPGNFASDVYTANKTDDAANRDIINAVSRVQELAYATLTRAHADQSAAAWREANAAKSQDWRGGFIDIGADIFSLHRAQIDVLRAALPGSVTVEPADVKTTLHQFARISEFQLSYVEKMMQAKYQRPIFNTDAEAAAVGRITATTWLASVGRIFKGAAFGSASDIKTGASEIADNAKAHFLLATKSMFLTQLRRPWAEVAASPFGAVAALGAPVLEAGRYLVSTGGVASAIPGLGNVGMIGLVGGFVLLLIGGTCVYLAPLLPALLWLSITASVFVGAFVAVIIIPLIALRLIDLEGDGIFGNAGEAFKPVIYYASLPALAALGLLCFSFLYGAIIAAGNSALLQAIGNEIEAGSVDAWSWLWWSVAYVIFVVVAGGVVAFKATWGLADFVAKTMAVNVPNHASDDGARIAAVALPSSRTVINQVSRNAAETTGGIARSAGGAIADRVGGSSGGGGVRGGSGGAAVRGAAPSSPSDQMVDVGVKKADGF